MQTNKVKSIEETINEKMSKINKMKPSTGWGTR